MGGILFDKYQSISFQQFFQIIRNFLQGVGVGACPDNIFLLFCHKRILMNFNEGRTGVHASISKENL